MHEPNRAPDSAEPRPHRGHRLLQAGMVLFFLALITGLFVHKFAVPRLALSAHLLGITQGLFLMVLGLLWSKLRLSRAWAQVALALVLYGCIAAWSANLLGAIWSAGSAMLPFAAGEARGSALQETIITVFLRTAAGALIGGCSLILWGLRSLASEQP